MSGLLETALSGLARGCHVIPCKPRDKVALIKSGKGTKWEAASNDPEQVRAWWTTWPTANVAIGCRKSKRCVLDVDHGLNSEEEARAWIARVGLPRTFTVRTGRRPEWGLQFHFEGVIPDVGEFQLDGCSGQIKSEGGYVMWPGSIHPDTGEAYEVWEDAPLAPIPDVVRTLRTVKRETLNTDATMQKIPEGAGRHAALMSFAGTLRHKGFDRDAILAQLMPANDAMCEVPISEEDLGHIAESAAGYALPEPDPVPVVGTKPPEPPKDWRERYLTFERVRDAKPTEFFIDGFLALDSITAIAAPVGQRKSLIALNVAHALCTGEPLFDYFKVSKQPERVVYLCPEMGLSSFSTRLKGIGLLEYVGQTLFCQTMDDTSVRLCELNEELPGAVLIVDTLTRFVDGDQNSSEDMSKFASEVFRLKRAGATILLLHHSIKGAANALTLDSAMRGSTELAAFVTSCWATKLKDPDAPYNSPSLLVNVKQRDFESKPFEVTSDKNCRLHIVGEPGAITELRRRGDAEAEAVLSAILKDSPRLGINKLQEALRAAGHKKGVKWVTKARAGILGTGACLVSA